MATEPLWFKRDILLGMSGPDVDVIRRKLGLAPGHYDRAAMEKVLGVARRAKVQTNGEVNEAVADLIGESEANKAETTPEWFTRPLDGLWLEGEDVRSLRRILGFTNNDNRYDPDTEAAVKRLQSGLGLEPTGFVDVDLARKIGEE